MNDYLSVRKEQQIVLWKFGLGTICFILLALCVIYSLLKVAVQVDCVAFSLNVLVEYEKAILAYQLDALSGTKNINCFVRIYVFSAILCAFVSLC